MCCERGVSSRGALYLDRSRRRPNGRGGEQRARAPWAGCVRTRAAAARCRRTGWQRDSTPLARAWWRGLASTARYIARTHTHAAVPRPGDDAWTAVAAPARTRSLHLDRLRGRARLQEAGKEGSSARGLRSWPGGKANGKEGGTLSGARGVAGSMGGAFRGGARSTHACGRRSAA